MIFTGAIGSKDGGDVYVTRWDELPEQTAQPGNYRAAVMGRSMSLNRIGGSSVRRGVARGRPGACAQGTRRDRPYEPVPPPPDDRPARVTVEWLDGTSTTAEVRSARGSADHPLTEADLVDKIGAMTGDAAPPRSPTASSTATRRGR